MDTFYQIYVTVIQRKLVEEVEMKGIIPHVQLAGSSERKKYAGKSVNLELGGKEVVTRQREALYTLGGYEGSIRLCKEDNKPTDSRRSRTDIYS